MSVAQEATFEIIEAGPLGAKLPTMKSSTLLKNDRVQLFRLVLPAGQETSTHYAAGEMIAMCLEGRAAFTAFGETHDLAAGQLIHVPSGEPHAVKAIQDTSLLLTVISHDDKFCRPADAVQEASEESFPASDAPSHTPVTGVTKQD